MRRLPKVRVKDLIQYRYTHGLTRYKTTQRVQAVIGEGASFIVKGGLEVSASDVLLHITVEDQKDENDDAL
jgi:hypothetical protein